jgi:hypothetical protein
MLFVFWLLGMGTIALSDKILYRSTVGNLKTYEQKLEEKRSRTVSLLETLGRQLDYSWRYL